MRTPDDLAQRVAMREWLRIAAAAKAPAALKHYYSRAPDQLLPLRTACDRGWVTLIAAYSRILDGKLSKETLRRLAGRAGSHARECACRRKNGSGRCNCTWWVRVRAAAIDAFAAGEEV